MLKVKLLSEVARLPRCGRLGDAGMDLYSPSDITVPAGGHRQIKLGIAIELPPHTFGMISERSGDAIKYGLHSIGNIIDSNYRGEISAILFNSSKEALEFKVGDRIAQLLVLPLRPGDSEIEQVTELSESNRGEQAHHSSGR